MATIQALQYEYKYRLRSVRGQMVGKYKNDYINSTCNVPLYLYQEGLLMLDRCQDSIEVSGSGVDCGYLCITVVFL